MPTRTISMLSSFKDLVPPSSKESSIHLNFLLTPQDIRSIGNQLITKSNQLIDQLVQLNESEQTFSNVIVPLGHMECYWQTISSSLTFPQFVSTDKTVRDAAISINKELDEFSIEKSMRKDLYKVVSNVASKHPQLSPEDSRLLSKMMEDYDRNGMSLPDDKQERLKDIKKKLSTLSIDFSSTMNEDTTFILFTKDDLSGCPQDYIDRLEQHEQHYKVTMKYPDYFGLMRFASSEQVRKKMSFQYESRCMSNIDRLAEAISLRQEAATLLGYPDHSSFILYEKMAKNPETVDKFLLDIKSRLEPLAEKERQVMTSMKRLELQDPQATLESWDYQYYTRKLEQDSSVDENQVKQYFEFNAVTKKMLNIYESVLSLSFQEVTDKSIWHPDIRLIKVTEATDPTRLVGYFYLDLFPRDGKYTHAACFTSQPGAKINDSAQVPVAVMVANFTKPTIDNPCLLKHDEVITYFHELGHVMHTICSNTKWARFHGTTVEGDFVETPSQMLENWCWDKRSISSLSGHYKRHNEPLPDDILNALIKSKLLNVGHFYLRQIFFGLFDMTVHSKAPMDYWNKERLIKLWYDLRKSVTKFQPQNGTFGGATFGHIMGGYDAGYYGYLWSLVISADFYSKFENTDDISSLGLEYRKKILTPGSSIDATDMIKDFLGRNVTQDAFLKSIGLQ